MGIGCIIKCMALECSLGLMVGSIMENIIWIKSREKESLYGRMEGCMRESGKMGSSMGREFIWGRIRLGRLGFGLKVKSRGCFRRRNRRINDSELFKVFSNFQIYFVLKQKQIIKLKLN